MTKNERTTVQIRLRRPDWTNTAISNYLFFKVQKVKSVYSLVTIEEVSKLTWSGDTVDTETLEIYGVEATEAVIEFSFMGNDKLTLDISDITTVLINDLEQLNESYLRIINGTNATYRKWLADYKST